MINNTEKINKYISHIHSWGSDEKMEIRNIRVSSKSGYIEWTLSAKQTKPIQGRIPVATNMEITLNGVSLIEVKNNEVFDMLNIEFKH